MAKTGKVGESRPPEWLNRIPDLPEMPQERVAKSGGKEGEGVLEDVLRQLHDSCGVEVMETDVLFPQIRKVGYPLSLLRQRSTRPSASIEEMRQTYMEGGFRIEGEKVIAYDVGDSGSLYANLEDARESVRSGADQFLVSHGTPEMPDAITLGSRLFRPGQTVPPEIKSDEKPKKK